VNFPAALSEQLQGLCVGFNLSLVMRQMLGMGTPRGLQGLSADAFLAFSAALDRGFGSHNTGKRIGSDTQVLLPCAAKLPSRSQQSEQTTSATGC